MVADHWGFAFSFIVLFAVSFVVHFTVSLIALFAVSFIVLLAVSFIVYSSCSGPRAKGHSAQLAIAWQPLIGDVHSHSLIVAAVAFIVFAVLWIALFAVSFILFDISCIVISAVFFIVCFRFLIHFSFSFLPPKVVSITQRRLH